jgi:methyl-accepting chemotaxis protein
MLPRRKFFSDMPDKGLFAVAAIVGFAGICALKLSAYDANMISVIAVAIMIAYGAIAYRMPLVQMRLDRLGDNFYYLGFIYTLASLSAALLQLQLFPGLEVQQLLGSFGIALVTTIVGIAGRVLFVQLRSELDDVEDRARRDLAATSADLRAQLAASVREFETLRTGLLQTLAETTAECTKATKTQIERIDELARSVAQQISSAFEGNTRQSERLADSVAVVARAVEDASKRVADMELPSERLNAQVAEFARDLEDVLRRLGAVVEDVARRSLPPRRWYWPFRR